MDVDHECSDSYGSSIEISGFFASTSRQLGSFSLVIITSNGVAGFL